MLPLKKVRLEGVGVQTSPKARTERHSGQTVVSVSGNIVSQCRALLEDQLVIVQEQCESRGGRPGLSVLTSLLVSEDVKLY